MYNNKSKNIKIETLYTPGSAFLDLSYFGTYLVLKLVPWIGKDHTGRDQYCRETYLSTTLSPEGAAYFHKIAISIFNGTEDKKQLPAVFQCKNGATLTLEYMPDNNNQMTAYLVINKNNETISFMFQTRQIKKWEDGQQVTRVIQADLEKFAWLLHGYLQKSGAEHLLNKTIGEAPKPEQTFAPIKSSSYNSNANAWSPPLAR